MVEMTQTLLVDAVVDAYVDWREEEARVRVAYRRWMRASEEDQIRAYAAYTAALDREERAAELYGAALGRYEQSRRPGGTGGWWHRAAPRRVRGQQRPSS